MDHNLIPIYNAANAIEAQLLKEQLEECGIECWITNEALQGAAGELPLGWTSSPRLLVASENAEKAREVALAFDERVVERSHKERTVPPEYDTSEPLDDPGYLWPRCPHCQQPRLAVCPFCKTAGNDFPLAYTGPEAGPPTHLFITCPMCDEVFEPKFYKLCEGCGHEYPDGVSVQQPHARTERDRFNENRIWIVVGVSLAFCALMAAYFWSLLGS